MVSLRYFKSLSHKEAEYFHMPQVTSLDCDPGCKRGFSDWTDRHWGEKQLQLLLLLSLKEGWAEGKRKTLWSQISLQDRKGETNTLGDFWDQNGENLNFQLLVPPASCWGRAESGDTPSSTLQSLPLAEGPAQAARTFPQLLLTPNPISSMPLPCSREPLIFS